MRKLFFAILIFAATIKGIYAQNKNDGQVKTTWGIKTEFNSSGFIISKTSDVAGEMKIGASGGGFVNFEIAEHFALQGELMYHYRTSDINISGLHRDFRFWGMQIPIYAIYQWKFARECKFYAGLGPYAEFGFDAKLKWAGEKLDLYKKDVTTEVSTMKDSDVGFGIIIGYEFAKGIQVNVDYKIGVTNILDANISALKMFPHAAGLGIGYRFGK